MEKKIKKEIKTVEKINHTKSGSKNETKKPSGFAKPTLVTNQLCEFMKCPGGTELARTEVNKYLINYIKTNHLQDESNKTIIIPDNNLKNLLDIHSAEPLTFFTLQKHMNKHFIKHKNVPSLLEK